MSTLLSGLKGPTNMAFLSEDDSDTSEIIEYEQLNEGDKLITSRNQNQTKTGSLRINHHRGLEDAMKCETLQEEVQQEEVLVTKRKEIALCLMAAGSVALLQGASLPAFYHQSLLVNISDSELRRTFWIIFYTCYIISCISSPLIMKLLSFKKTLISGCIVTIIYAILRFSDQPYFVIPSAIIGGALIVPMQVSLLCYSLVIAIPYSIYGGGNLPNVINLFQGIFTSWSVGSMGINSCLHLLIVYVNSHTEIDSLPTDQCGVTFTWSENIYPVTNSSYNDVHERRIHGYLSATLICAVIALCVGYLCVDSSWYKFHEDVPFNSNNFEECTGENCCMTLSGFTNATLVLMVPMYVYIGMMWLFGATTFGQAFSLCTGRLYASFVLVILFSLSGVLASLLTGYTVRYIGRVKLVIICIIFSLVSLVVLVAWRPLPGFVYVLFVITFGSTAACLEVAMLGMSGCVFRSHIEQVLSVYKLCQGVGYIILSSLLYTKVRSEYTIFTLIGVALLAGLCYICVEIKVRLKDQKDTRSMDGVGYMVPENASWIPSFDPVTVHKEKTSSLLSRIPSVSEQEMLEND